MASFVKSPRIRAQDAPGRALKARKVSSRRKGACRCPERFVPVDKRGWMVTAFQISTGRRVKRTKASTVTCVECGSVWRSVGKFLEKLS